MKNYDLSQYMLRRGDIILFPITQEEVGILKQGKEAFEKYIRMPYVTGVIATDIVEGIESSINMDDDYWFMNTLWIVAHIPSKEIFGTIRYKSVGEESRVITNVTMLSDVPDTYEGAIKLFVDFLSVNNYKNIAIAFEEKYED